MAANGETKPTTALAQINVGERGLQLITIDDLWRFAQMVAKSGLAPEAKKGVPMTPEQIFVATQHGAELGLAPMQSIQGIAVINGRPSVWGDTLLALVLASPLCAWIEEWTEGRDSEMVAVCITQRRGRPKPVERRFSVNDAKKAGLWGKQGPWQTNPKRMLQMRARAFDLRDTYADLLKGLSVAEEVLDYGACETFDPTKVEPDKPRGDAIADKLKKPAQEPEPAIDVEHSPATAAQPPPTAAPSPEAPTEPQRLTCPDGHKPDWDSDKFGSTCPVCKAKGGPAT